MATEIVGSERASAMASSTLEAGRRWVSAFMEYP
jgi:hypothetical protein